MAWNWAVMARLDEDAQEGDPGSLNDLAAAYLLRYGEEHPTDTLSSMTIQRCRVPTSARPQSAEECVDVGTAAAPSVLS